MKLDEYINNLQKILETNPDYAKLDVITAKDDEGNGYNTVHYTPSVGWVDEDFESFVNENNADDVDFEDDELNINCVCVN